MLPRSSSRQHEKYIVIISFSSNFLRDDVTRRNTPQNNIEIPLERPSSRSEGIATFRQPSTAVCDSLGREDRRGTDFCTSRVGCRTNAIALRLYARDIVMPATRSCCWCPVDYCPVQPGSVGRCSGSTVPPRPGVHRDSRACHERKRWRG